MNNGGSIFRCYKDTQLCLFVQMCTQSDFPTVACVTCVRSSSLPQGVTWKIKITGPPLLSHSPWALKCLSVMLHNQWTWTKKPQKPSLAVTNLHSFTKCDYHPMHQTCICWGKRVVEENESQNQLQLLNSCDTSNGASLYKSWNITLQLLYSLLFILAIQ